MVSVKSIYHIIVFAVVFIVVGMGNTACSRDEKAKQEAEIDSFPVLINQIRSCSRLYTTEIKVHKIVTHDDQLKLQGKILSKEIDVNLPFGERKIAIPMDATLKGYIDFSDFTEDNIKRRGGKIEVLLPNPQVEITSSRIDHDEIMQHVALFRSDFTDKELTAYEQQGRRSILKSADKMGIAEHARIGAANVLIPIIMQFGYDEKDIIISFSNKQDTSNSLLDFDKKEVRK